MPLATDASFVCRRCGDLKTREEASSRNSKRGYNYYCKKCHSQKNTEYARAHREQLTNYQRAYREKNRDRVRAYYLRHRLKRFGITAEQYAVFLEKQEFACAICRMKFEKALCVDHDHASGRVRGLLCSQCNLVVGNSKEDRRVLLSAINYIARS